MEHLPQIVTAPLVVVGGLFCAYLALCLLKLALGTLRTFTGRKNLRCYGSWAIVTGSTDGIGKEIAIQLARQQINLVLVSRTQEKLDAVAKEISGQFNVEVKTEVMDVSVADQEDYLKLGNSYKDLDIGIIVNNVGLSYDHPEYLDSAEPSRLWKILRMNTIPCTFLPKAFLANMVAKKIGLVVNVGSTSGIFNTPLLSVYSASKSYVHSLTDALRLEYADKGIHFQTLCPMFVATAMTGMKPSLTRPKPEVYAAAAVGTFGKTDFTCGYLPHTLQVAFYSLAPKCYFNGQQLALMKKGRARWHKKQEAKKE